MRQLVLATVFCLSALTPAAAETLNLKCKDTSLNPFGEYQTTVVLDLDNKTVTHRQSDGTSATQSIRFSNFTVSETGEVQHVAHWKIRWPLADYPEGLQIEYKLFLKPHEDGTFFGTYNVVARDPDDYDNGDTDCRKN